MGTRADFYVGTGPDAEWLGSIAFDGYRIDELKAAPKAEGAYAADSAACWAIKSAASADAYRAAVAGLLAINDDATKPDQGWPWPWDDSKTTDYTYAFVDGSTKTFPWGEGAEWPDMKERANVQIGGMRSGIMLLVGK